MLFNLLSLRVANASVFIDDLPDQYETKVGERGALLSGGQRQRLCIARTVVPEPRVLLLDEATSSLDGESEVLVRTALHRAAAGRSVLTIAHNLRSVVDSDRFGVMERGTVVEFGSYEELMAIKDGKFKLFFRK